MLKYLEEYGKFVAFAGFRSVRIVDVEDFLRTVKMAVPRDVGVQFFDAGLVATWQHLYFAALNALNAFKNGTNISKSMAIEVMLYASGQRQIRRAMEILGIKPCSEAIAILVIGDNNDKVEAAIQTLSKIVGGHYDEKVLDFSRKKIRDIRNVFGISDLELEAVMRGNNLEEALVNLVIERMALLSTEH